MQLSKFHLKITYFGLLKQVRKNKINISIYMSLFCVQSHVCISFEIFPKFWIFLFKLE